MRGSEWSVGKVFSLPHTPWRPMDLKPGIQECLRVSIKWFFRMRPLTDDDDILISRAADGSHGSFEQEDVPFNRIEIL